MDKQNYTLNNGKNQDIKEQFEEIQRYIEKEFEKHRLIKRKRVIKNYSILFRAAYLYIIESLSFQRISDKMSCIYGVTMSDTAWKKQLTKVAPVFASAAMCYMNHKTTSAPSPKSILGHSSAYALDATALPAEGKNGIVFRLHTQYSLIENVVTKIHMTDCYSAESVEHYDIVPGALYFADRAYGRSSQFSYMIDKQADFIFRISYRGVKLFHDADCKNRVNFKSLLHSKKIAIRCYFKFKDTAHPIRLIAAPIPKEKHDSVEKRVRKEACRKQYSISDASVEFSKWVILATSLTAVSDEEILDAYRLRWQIELFFKRAKSLLNFHRLRHSATPYMHTAVLLWTAVIFSVSALAFSISLNFNFDISLFNLFSLSTSLFS